jgi:hypothetical protein
MEGLQQQALKKGEIQMLEDALENFIRIQRLTGKWRIDADDHLMENTVTLKVNLTDGTSKVLSVNQYEIKLYKSYFKNLVLFSWTVKQSPLELKQHISELLEGDSDILFFEIVSIMVWWRESMWS